MGSCDMLIAFLEAKRKKAEEEGIKEEGTIEQIKALEKEQAMEDAAMQAAAGGGAQLKQPHLKQQEACQERQQQQESEKDKENELVPAESTTTTEHQQPGPILCPEPTSNEQQTEEVQEPAAS